MQVSDATRVPGLDGHAQTEDDRVPPPVQNPNETDSLHIGSNSSSVLWLVRSLINFVSQRFLCWCVQSKRETSSRELIKAVHTAWCKLDCTNEELLETYRHLPEPIKTKLDEKIAELSSRGQSNSEKSKPMRFQDIEKPEKDRRVGEALDTLLQSWNI